MVDWQGLSNGASFSYAPVATDGIGIVQGRTMENGSHPIIINALHCYAGGYGGSRNFTATLGGASGRFSKGPGQASDSGWFPTSGWFVNNGGQATFTLGSDGNGGFYFGKGSSGSTRNTQTGYVWGGGLAGGYSYVQGPEAPTITFAGPMSNVAGQIDIQWRGNDNGGAPFRTYAIWRDGRPLAETGTQGRWIDTVTPGTTHEYWVTAHNEVSDKAGTFSRRSNSVIHEAPGNPTAVRSLTATASPTVYGRVTLNWTAPVTSPGGPVVSYIIYDKGVAVATVGNVTTWVGNNLGNNVSHTFEVRAQNAFSKRNNQSGPSSNKVTVVSPGPPSAPLNLTATASESTAGRITLNWSPPADLAGGVTRYSVYQGTNTTPIGYTPTPSYVVNDLVPGTSYSFYVRAWNDAADIAGVPGPASSTVVATATGEPPAPVAISAVPSDVVAGRLKVSWQNPGGVISGYYVYMRPSVTQPWTRVSSTVNLSVNIDGLDSATTYSFTISARNAVTDAKNTEGPRSNIVSGIPGTTTTQNVDNAVVLNQTNDSFAGTYRIVSTTSTTVSYVKTAISVPSTPVGSGATIVDNTNAELSGSYAIASTPTPTTFVYNRTTANLAEATAVGGTTFDNTNAIFNGLYTVTAVDVPNKRVSYAKSSLDISTRNASGTITNTTNAAFNGTGITISAVTLETVSYARAGSPNVVETVSTGTITNTTNRDVFNGVKVITRTPEYNTVMYATPAAPAMPLATIAQPYGGIRRSVSPASLRVRYRSGWAG